MQCKYDRAKYTSLLLPALSIIVPVFVPILNNNLYYYIPTSLVNSAVLFTIYPDVANFFFRRSVTYDDLIDKYCREDSNKWQRYFTTINIVLSSFLITFIVYYVVQKYRWTEIVKTLDVTHGVNIEIIDTIGIISGLIGLFRKWQVIMGKIIIKVLFYCKRESTAARAQTMQRI